MTDLHSIGHVIGRMDREYFLLLTIRSLMNLKF
jgi:hypothetical protein